MNIVDPDLFMRVFNNKFDTLERLVVPLFGFHQFRNAVPIVLHHWLFMVLNALGGASEV